MAVAHIDAARKMVRFSGLGNITAAIHREDSVRHLVSHHGTAGHGTRRIEEYTYPWDDQSVLVMHSDGITARHDLAAYPGLLQRHPGLVAGVLYRDFARGRDDATVVVARRNAA
jgi:Stage II sporulation protein E (SpoIIE)